MPIHPSSMRHHAIKVLSAVQAAATSHTRSKPRHGLTRRWLPWQWPWELPPPDLRGTPLSFPSLDCTVTGDEKSTYLAPRILCGRRGEISVEAQEGRPLPPSPDESSREDLLQVRV